MKRLVDQLPFVKTGKPAVKRIMIHMTSARGVENSVTVKDLNELALGQTST